MFQFLNSNSATVADFAPVLRFWAKNLFKRKMPLAFLRKNAAVIAYVNIFNYTFHQFCCGSFLYSLYSFVATHVVLSFIDFKLLRSTAGAYRVWWREKNCTNSATCLSAYTLHVNTCTMTYIHVEQVYIMLCQNENITSGLCCWVASRLVLPDRQTSDDDGAIMCVSACPSYVARSIKRICLLSMFANCQSAYYEM